MVFRRARDWRIALLLLPAALGLGLGIWWPAAERTIVALAAEITARNLAWGAGAALTLLALATALLWHLGCRRGRRDAVASAREETRRFQLNLDHEIKNRLNAVRGGLDHIAGLDLDEADRRIIAIIRDEALCLSRMAEMLRHIVAVETAELDRQPVEIGPLIERLCATVAGQPERTGRRLVVSVPRAWPLPPVPGDEDMLAVALYNLIDNACKYTHPGDLVEVTAAQEDHHVVIGVADTGPGIAADEIDRLWEPLYRGRDARAVQGSGLGLALVRAIVERHGGTASAESVPGERTRFEVRLPAR